MTSAACGEMLVEHPCLERRVLARRVRVERPAERLERQRDLASRVRRAVPLNTMCSSRCDTPICSRGSCTRRRAHPGPKRDRPHSRHVLREYGQSIRQYGAAEAPAPSRACHRRSTSLSAASASSAAAATAATAAARRSPLAVRSRRAAARHPRRRSPLRRPRRGRRDRAAPPSGRRSPSGFGMQRLHRETQTSALVAIDELHLHAIALLDHVFRLLGAAVPQLGDVDAAPRCPA